MGHHDDERSEDCNEAYKDGDGSNCRWSLRVFIDTIGFDRFSFVGLHLKFANGLHV